MLSYFRFIASFQNWRASKSTGVENRAKIRRDGWAKCLSEL